MRIFSRIVFINPFEYWRASILSVGLLGLVASTAVGGEEPCDVKVVVRDYDGRPFDAEDVPVSAVTMDGVAIANATARNGIARLCDVGIREFTVVVGKEMCAQVRVRFLRVRERPLVVPVYYRRCHGFEASSGCQVLLRVKNSVGARLPDAIVKVPGMVPPLRSDSLGRVEFSLPYSPSATDIAVSRSGYSTGGISVRCMPSEPRLEKTVTLSRVD